MIQVVLLTGGNLGRREENIRVAREQIAQRIGKITVASSVYESEPWGFETDCPFLNQVVVVDTDLEPEQVLDACQEIENELGRKRLPEAGDIPRQYVSRTMDIDILFYGDRAIDTFRLQVPHPLIAERMFVLDPLHEVLPDLIHPVLRQTVSELRQVCLEREMRQKK